MTIIEAVDEMNVAGPAASGADREFAGEMGLRSRRERTGFLVPHVNPIDFTPTAGERFEKGVQRVADHAVNAFDSRGDECLDQNFGDGFLGHGSFYFWGWGC